MSKKKEIFVASVYTQYLTILVPSTLIRLQTKTELFCSGYGYRPQYNAENDHQKRSHSKTLSRVERFENDALWKLCFLVCTENTREYGDATGCQTTRPLTRPWVSKMAERRFHVASISRLFAGWYIEMCMRRVHLSMCTEGMKAFSKRVRRCSVDGWKRYENDKRGRKYFWKWSKTAPFSFENGLVWTGPLSVASILTLHVIDSLLYTATLQT